MKPGIASRLDLGPVSPSELAQAHTTGAGAFLPPGGSYLVWLLRVSETELRQLHELFEEAPVNISVYRGPELRVEMFNACCRQRIGAAARRPYKGEPLLAVLPELADQSVYQVLLNVYHSGTPATLHEHKVDLANENGQLAEHYFTTYYQPLRANGQVWGLMAVSYEVTDQVRDRQRAEALVQELKEASRAKDEFLAMLGHELRNPLAPILTALELIQLRGCTYFERECAIIQRHR